MINNLLYKEKNYSKIKELLKDSENAWSFNILGKIYLYEQNIYLAKEYFNKAENLYGCAYCEFLQDNYDEAKILLTIIQNSSPASDWLLNLIKLVEGNLNIEPTYFQIRNFYEQDLELMFKYNKTEIIEKIILKNYCLEMFNREIYKYSGRVFLNNRYYEQAKIFLRKSLDISYKDPETHYMMGEIYEKENNKEQAINSYKKALDTDSGYIPAMQKLNHLSY